MRILVTGASGTVGEATIDHLVKDKEHKIIAFDLNKPRVKRVLQKYHTNIKIIYGDITDPQAIAQACSNIDVVIHLAAIIPPLADDEPEMAALVNTTGTKNLLDAIKVHSPKAFFIYASSIAVYGDRLKNPNIKVGDPLLPSEGDEYSITKINAENLVLNSDLDFTIFRLTAVMGATNHKMSKLMFHMPLITPIQLISPGDCGNAFAKAIAHKEVLNRNIYNLSGGSQCDILYRDLLTRSFINAGLGKFDLPEKAFAEKNFHCGYYADGDDLEAILQFRSETVEDYFKAQEASINPIVRSITKILKRPIKHVLALKSEPLQALKKDQKENIKRFFV